MTISVKHAFTSAKGDGTDATLVRPSNWNAEHTITLATDKLLGRATAGTGAVEEITCTSAARSILDDATIADILTTLGVSPPTTGDARLTIKSTPTTGWVMMDDGTIGDASSSASNRANADCEDLFTLIYDNIADSFAPVLTSAGAATTRAAQGTAATAWAAHCRITLPLTVGRALVGMGAAGSWALGETYGEDDHTLLAAEVPTHTHTFSDSDSFSGTTSGESADHTHDVAGWVGWMNQNASHTHGVTGGIYGGTAGYYNFGNFDGIGAPVGVSAVTISSTSTDHQHYFSATSGGRSAGHTHTYSGSVSISGTTSAAGSGGAHNNIQKSVAFNIMMKL